MSSRRRHWLAFWGALLLWSGLACTALFAAAAVWLLVDGSQPSWIILAVTVPMGLVGWWLIRRSGVPVGEALNL
ncbi:hypothetical protein JL108_19430 [Aeromicrobium sp. YIM 150415]|uniref:hypothetical protein n=1 Tax=Aeromicrobium sp. YIM 150415 TaxID=2803912 RepID=UPI001966C3F7|nr:hypothetical protein [Aeromicrobium sp. YIM 150415]MBM9465628.1 hypothetical protein [Aeromicrobium sp. YIM 150415]